MQKEFEVHILNSEGIEKAVEVAQIFDFALNKLLELYSAPSRELSIVRTKLEEACFFAKKAVANDPANQKS